MAMVETLGKIRRFEDLIAWQKARELTLKIYRISRQGEFGKDYRLSGQIQGAAVSIMSNIAEGFERGRLGEFHQFLSTEKASCEELRTQLYVALDVGYIKPATFRELREQSEEVGRIIGGLRASVAKQKQNKLNRT